MKTASKLKILLGVTAACIGIAAWSARAAAQQRVAAQATQPLDAKLGVAPDVLLKEVSTQVLAILKRDYDAGNPSKVAQLVEARILPHFDFPQMTRIAVALNWRAATPEQQSALVAEFKTLLVRTYSVALASYRDQNVEYKPLRARPGDTDVTVQSVVLRPGVEPLTIDYDMEKTEAGWKVYDVKVAGVSLIITYQTSFAAEARERGVDGLVKLLAEKNRQHAR